MGKKLPEDQMELYRRVDEVLTYVWNPVGVAEVPQARDEYRGYLPQIFQQILSDESPEIIADYLIMIETESMGYDNSINTRKRALEIAKLLLEHYEWVKQKYRTNSCSGPVDKPL